MSKNICFNCFKIRGEFDVCPHCGYVDGTLPSQASFLKPGVVLDNRYIIGTSIGSGGFGIIYKAYDTVLSKIVAVKEHFPARLVNRAAGEEKVGICSGTREKEYKKRLDRFLLEAKNMAAFSKEKDIVNVYRFFQANGTAYIIMEYIDSELLKDHLRKNGRMEAGVAIGYTAAILEALGKLHQKGIIHKDISPDNIFLTGDHEVKIFDFGAAAFLHEDEEELEPVIKPGYAPPEQYASKYSKGPFMDIYSTGAVLYEMITGEKPCEGSDRLEKDELKRPSSFGVPIQKNLEKIILKAMAVRIEYRFQTAEEFRQALLDNKSVYEPEEVEKRQERKGVVRYAAIALSMMLLIMIVLLSALYKYRSERLDLSKIQDGQLTVWLAGETSATQSERISQIKKQFQKDCPQIDLQIQEIAYDKYEEKWKEAAKKQQEPDVFCTDFLDGEAKEQCITLEKLQKTINEEQFPMLPLAGEKLYEMPTGFQVALLYQNLEKYQNDTSGADQIVGRDQFKTLAGEELGIYDKVDEFVGEKSKVKAVAADNSYYDAIGDRTIRSIPAKELKIALICGDDGKGLTQYCQCYGVNKTTDESKRMAGMYCIQILLSEELQISSYMSENRGIPLQAQAQSEYRQAHLVGYLDCIGSNMDNLEQPVMGVSIADYYQEYEK